MKEIKEFKTESKRLLDLMINSIYTNKEIFLRELISNASDAIDKYHYLALKDESLSKDEGKIELKVNKENRTITIIDNGLGMNYDELVNNLGTIAKSGSAEFINKLKENKDDKEKELEIIGQFGVGFYSAFMVASKVEVLTRSYKDENAYLFMSTGEDTYEIDKASKDSHGSEITLYLRDNKDDENYDSYLEEYEIRHLVSKYSDYVHYPITMLVSKQVNELDENGKGIEGKYKEVKEEETLNSMIPLWKKAKKDVTEEALNEFYKSKFMDFQDPLLALQVSTEGMITYNSLLFIPKKAPYDLYSESYEKGLQLYTKGVFIMDKCKELIPDYLRFVKGLVDSSDLSLNISREMLQQDKQLVKIKENIEKKLLAELTKIKENDFDKYVEFFKTYGINFKYGVYEGFGVNKDKLQDLLIYESINNDKYISLKDYVDNMKDKQEFIYYVSAKNKEAVMSMPQMDLIKDKGYDVLLLTDNVDEFAINVLKSYNNKNFKSINQGDLDLLDKDKKEEIEKVKDQKKPLIDKLKELLKDKVKDVVISSRLTDSPVCLVSGDGLSFEMEKVLKENPAANEMKADKILEINASHDLFKAIEKVYVSGDYNSLEEYASLLLDQALLMEGFNIEDPVKFSNSMCKLMINSINK